MGCYVTHSNRGTEPQSHNIQTQLHTFVERPIVWLNGHCPVITDHDNVSAALCSSDSLPVSLHQSPKLLTRWLLCNDHWNGSFCLSDTAIHSLNIMARQYWDHSSNSNDCCCGSLSQLMTFAMGWGKCLYCCRCRSVHLSVSKTLEVTAYSGRPTDKNSACSYECFHSIIHSYMKKIRHTPPHSWAPCPLEWHGCWPTPPYSLQQSHILRGWITAPRLDDSPGDRWRGHMVMVVRLLLPYTDAYSQKRNKRIVYGYVLIVLQERFINFI